MELPPATPHDARPAMARMDFDGAPGCIAAARQAASAFLRHHAAHTPEARRTFHDDVVLVVSELVTNAVRHAPGSFVMELGLLPDGVGITVRDTSPGLPRFRTPDLTGGRGWPLVQTLTRRVCVVPLPDGKAIHAELAW